MHDGLDLNLVQVFTKVVEAKSFTAAARALELPKSSVSRMVSRLEDGLGVRLLQRTTRKLGLTAAGERYLAEVRGAITHIAEASSEIGESGQAPRGPIRVSLPPEIGSFSISDLLVAFVRKYPLVTIDMLVTARHVNLVEEGVDLALRAGKLSDSSLHARKVGAGDHHLCAAPAYLAARGRPRRLGDLTAHDCVRFRSASGYVPWRLLGPRGHETVTVTGPITADDLESVRRLCVAGLGVALIPEAAVRQDMASGTLERVLPTYAFVGAALYLVSPPLRHAPVRVTLLRDFLLEEIGTRLFGLPRRRA